AEEVHLVLYSISHSPNTRTPIEIRTLNTQTGENRFVMICESFTYCPSFDLRPDGQFFAYTDSIHTDDDNTINHTYIYNLQSSQLRLIDTRGQSGRSQRGVIPQWLDNNNDLIFRVSGDYPPERY